MVVSRRVVDGGGFSAFMVRATVRRRAASKQKGKAPAQKTGLEASWALREAPPTKNLGRGSPRRAALHEGAIAVGTYLLVAIAIISVWWRYGRTVVAWLLGGVQHLDEAAAP